jgi:hypothetical protein
MDERSRHRQFEAQFFRQLQARAREIVSRSFPADVVLVEEVPDGADAVRAALTRLRVYDRDAMNALPGTRAAQLRFQKRVFGPLRTTISRVRAQVLTSIDALVAGQAPGPIGREQILDALARYELLPRAERPTGVILASPTGFTPEARALVHRAGPPSLILMGGRADGGWDVDMPAAVFRSPWARLFELESQDERVKRLMYHLEKNADLLDSRGVSVHELAEQIGLSRRETAALVREACRVEPHLMTLEHDGKLHVCRTPLAEEKSTMGMWSRIRKLLGLKPTVAERVRQMTAQRVQLERMRHEVDQRVNALEGEERELISRGATAPSDAEKRQVAAKLMRTRRDLKRLRSEEAVYTKQIDILGTQIHHATLTERGKRIALPSADELTREAAQAEQMLNELAANAELAARIETNAQTPAMAAEEADILREFEQVAARQAGPAAEAATSRSHEATKESAAAGVAGPAPAPPVPSAGDKSKARPEIG